MHYDVMTQKKIVNVSQTICKNFFVKQMVRVWKLDTERYMAKAIVTFEDDGDQVKVSIDFGEGGGNETSPAHHMAVNMVQMASQMMGTPGQEQVQ